MSNKRGISINKIESLKQATIINYSEIIDYDSNLDLYDTMIRNVFDGHFDDILVNDIDLKNESKSLELAKKYSSLCFFEGNIDYWLDSIEGISLSDLDLVSSRLLGNYIFLIKLADLNGEDSLKQLLEIQKADQYDGNSVIEHLRNSFISDDILGDVILKMSNKDNMYDIFNNTQKAILLNNPEGIIYDSSEDNVEVVNIQDKIKNYFVVEDDRVLGNFNLKDIMEKMSDDDFIIMIDSIQNEYQLGLIKNVKK